LESRSPTDLSNIPGFGAQRKMIRPVEKVAQGIKKEGETFGFYPLDCVYDFRLTVTFHIYNQEGSPINHDGIGR
jgi:hypothetical protein